MTNVKITKAYNDGAPTIKCSIIEPKLKPDTNNDSDDDDHNDYDQGDDNNNDNDNNKDTSYSINTPAPDPPHPSSKTQESSSQLLVTRPDDINDIIIARKANDPDDVGHVEGYIDDTDVLGEEIKHVRRYYYYFFFCYCHYYYYYY